MLVTQSYHLKCSQTRLCHFFTNLTSFRFISTFKELVFFRHEVKVSVGQEDLKGNKQILKCKLRLIHCVSLRGNNIANNVKKSKSKIKCTTLTENAEV